MYGIYKTTIDVSWREPEPGIHLPAVNETPFYNKYGLYKLLITG